jgi:hypothetical protein
MGVRENAIAAAEAKLAEQESGKEQAANALAAALPDREMRSRRRALELARDWIKDKSADLEKAQITEVDYYYQQQPPDRSAQLPFDQPYRNGVLLSWRVDNDTCIGEYSYFSGDRKSQKYEFLQVWIAIDGSLFFALTNEELGLAYLGKGITHRNSGPRLMARWSPLFAHSNHLYPR